MENKIENVLEFYANSNLLKEKIIDIDNHFSVADHLFGSMILASAFDSEFKEVSNLSKIYRMLLLDEINKLNVEYNLNLNQKYINELKEYYHLSTNDSKFAFKCKMLDIFLSNMIYKYENKLSYNELLEEVKNLISLFSIGEEKDCENIFRFYYLNYRLKNKIRSGWNENNWNIKSERIERVSEHIIGTLIVALAMQNEFNYNIDFDKVFKILVLHETGETIIGDITPFDGISPEEKEKIEHKAMFEALASLTEKDIILELLFGFDEHKTKESRFSYYCDKIEADLQSKIYQDKGLHHTLDEQINNNTFKNPIVKTMIQNGATTPFDIWYEWDKNKFENDKDFKEFIQILQAAKEINLHDLNNSQVKLQLKK